jgi:hypothetical protein
MKYFRTSEAVLMLGPFSVIELIAVPDTEEIVFFNRKCWTELRHDTIIHTFVAFLDFKDTLRI